MSNQTNGFIGGDERLSKVDGRRKGRDSADVERTQQDGTAFTAAERRRNLRNEFSQEVLPTPAPIPGYHLCWLSTTSQGDAIHNRMRIGYQPVKASECPGFDKFSQKGGEWDGFVSCNEMILFKLPEEIYQDLMVLYHHEMPLEEEQGIRQKVESETDSNGKTIGQVIGNGFDEMSKPVRIPTFI